MAQNTRENWIANVTASGRLLYYGAFMPIIETGNYIFKLI